MSQGTTSTRHHAGPGAGQGTVRRLRAPIAVTLAVVLIAVVGALSLPKSAGGRLDPRNAAPEGARAVAQILGDQGVRVERVTLSTQAAAAVTAATETTVLITDTRSLGPGQFQRLDRTGADLVLVEPDGVALAELDPELRVAGTRTTRDADPGCAAVDPIAAGTVVAGGQLYEPAPAGSGTGVGNSAGAVTICYPARTNDEGTGSYATVEREGRRITVLGQHRLLTNERLAREGNAALALRTLGRDRTLVWYQPDPLELRDADQTPTLGELLPPWVPWVTAQVALALLLALLWRARRTGPLVGEPLPVIVRAAETQEGRARLYRQAGARGQAADTLRVAARRRLARRLDVAPEAPPVVLADRIAALTGLPSGGVRETLLGAAPRDDTTLVRLAADLDHLEARVTGAPPAEPSSGSSTAAPPPAAPQTAAPATAEPPTAEPRTRPAGSASP